MPHDVEHVDQGCDDSSHGATSQAAAHACVLHGFVSSVCGHASPPKKGPACARVRDWEPPLHDLVQLDQSLSLAAQSVMVQSSGHACVLHGFVSSVCGHASPPKLGAACVRVRDLEPPPHDLVQLDQSLSPAAQLSMVQSAGQLWLLHTCISCECAHGSPPYKALPICVRARD
jgi:hypothetical protein